MTEKGETSRQRGSRYEQLAAAFLLCQGYEILEKIFHSRQGEIDLIARDGRYLVFVEVKYRKSLAGGDPAEAVDRKKRSKILKTARYYMAVRGIPEETPCRLDVVSVLDGTIRLIRDAFWE